MAARDIPDEINIHRLINSHIVEIHSLKRQCKTKQCKQTLQRIPRHMRRRAASNNPKRMPKALQQQHGGGGKFRSNDHQPKKKKAATAEPPKKKRKKSKSRNVSRRNADPRRTPLHLWFAKRFQLQLSWGRLQPFKNNLKNQRLLYRCSKAGYTLFYLPFRCSLLVEGSCQRKETVLAYLNAFLSPEDADLLRELVTINENRSGKSGQTVSVDLYAPGRWPMEVTGPLQITYFDEEEVATENRLPSEDQKTFRLLLSAHVKIQEVLASMFARSSDSDDDLNKYSQVPGFGELRLVDPGATDPGATFQLHHIRLFGRKAAHRLSQLFTPTNKGLLKDLPLNQMAIFQAGSPNQEESFKETLVSLDQLLQHTDLQPSKATSQSSISSPITFAVLRRQLNSGGECGSGAPMELLDLAIPLAHLKPIWSRLTANQSHLVGGLRDLEVLALETRSTFFPSIGYADQQSCQSFLGEAPEKSATDGDHLAGKFLAEEDRTFFVVRQRANPESLALPSSMCSATATVCVTIEYVKGKPRRGAKAGEELLYPPDAASLEAYLRVKSDDQNGGDGERVKVKVAEEDEDGQQLAIGYLEGAGGFSLDAARCRATAIIKVAGLQQLARRQQALRERIGLEKMEKPRSKSKQQQSHWPPLYAVVKRNNIMFNQRKPQQQHCNLVTVAVMNVKENWL